MISSTPGTIIDSLLAGAPRTSLAVLPTPVQPLARLTRELDGPELWLKRDDLTGLVGGGNKTRKLEFLVGDALVTGADTLVTVGAIQSNHTRQTAAAAAKAGLQCALLHNSWAPEPGAHYRRAGNILFSGLLGARLYFDPAPREVGEPGKLDALVEHLREQGRRPYVIPGGASEHPLGGHGYMLCAAEIAAYADQMDMTFDYVVHCTGSSSTQSGLLAGFAALGTGTSVIGIADDADAESKRQRVLRLANGTLDELGVDRKISPDDVHVEIADDQPYGVASERILDAIRLLARTEGIMADPVYEGRTIRGLIDLIGNGTLRRGQRVLVMHLGGTPAIHGYADQFGEPELVPLDAPA